MPLYRYQCDCCGNDWELLQSFAEHNRLNGKPIQCPQCKTRARAVFPVPAIRTNTSWLAGVGDGIGDRPATRRRAYEAARAQGINPNGKVYVGQLHTWVSDLDEAKRICKQRGLGMEGQGASIKPVTKDPEPEKPYQVAEDIVSEEVDRIVERNVGDVTPGERAKLTDETRERLSGAQV